MTAIDKVLMVEFALSLLERLGENLYSRSSMRWRLVSLLHKHLKLTLRELKRNITNVQLNDQRRLLWNDYWFGSSPSWLRDAWLKTLGNKELD